MYDGELPCVHMKVYGMQMLQMDPPRIKWVCKRCGEMGEDPLREDQIQDDYNDIVKKFHGHD